MKQRKKTYDVKVERYGESFSEHYKTIRIIARNKAQAEDEAKYQVEGVSCWCQRYGTGDDWYSYRYIATEVTE